MRRRQRHDADATALSRNHVRRPLRDLADDLGEILDVALGRQRIVGRHGAGAPESTLIDANHPVSAREMRNPRAPRFRAFGEAVHEEHRLRLRPGIGVVVHEVVQLAVGQRQVGHGFALSSSFG